MALMQCPECHREVSDHADKCPHCGFPIALNIPFSDAALDDRILEMRASEGMIAAIKLYRTHRPAVSLAEAKAHVEQLAAARPFEYSAPQDSTKGGNSVGCLYIFIALLLGFVLWVLEPRIHRAWDQQMHPTGLSAPTPTETPR